MTRSTIINVVLTISSWLSMIAADRAYFVNPPQFDTQLDTVNLFPYTLGSTIELQWHSINSTYELDLWQQQGSGSNANTSLIKKIYQAVGNGTGDQYQSWTVSPSGANITASNLFYIAATYSGETLFACHYFNMIEPAGANANASSMTNMSSNASSSATNIGLGVGLGVGIPLTLLVVGHLALSYMRQRKTTATESKARELDGDQSHQSPGFSAYLSYAEQKSSRPEEVHEIAGGNLIEIAGGNLIEAPGEPPRR